MQSGGDGVAGRGANTGAAIHDPQQNNLETDAQPFSMANTTTRPMREWQPGFWKVLHTLSTRDSEEYELSVGKRLCVVLNHIHFADPTHISRDGTNLDAEAICATFSKLDFEVELHTDLTFKAICSVMEQLKSRSGLCCLALFILTHGQEQGVLHAYDQPYLFNKIIVDQLVPMECPSLAGKPKMVFLQACQGDGVDQGAMLRHTGSSSSLSSQTSIDGNSCYYTIPNYADFLIFQSSYYGHISFRAHNGSWFIQSICRELACSKPEDDLHSVLIRVSRFVALYYSSPVSHDYDQNDSGHKMQIPLRQDTLIRHIYLKRTQSDFSDLMDRLQTGPRRQTSPATDSGQQSSSMTKLRNADLSVMDKCACM